MFPSLVYFYKFSFQFHLEKCRGDVGVWFGFFRFWVFFFFIHPIVLELLNSLKWDVNSK